MVPDHEVLRKIGGGSYGEVWLARGVTGALRAVKVVWREDFEDERSFEREFEGILKFEPISRDHPALVHVLHVGRGVEEGNPFYFYVMELGDDVRGGQKINPADYEPRTLQRQGREAVGEAMPVDECIEVGLRLAEGLGHLHSQGLAHRDVKPSNVIFVNGKAKLADIGLVAARGQRTFVGTEGFVPPEGPGTAQADLYSLGKVLYELATGKDRMRFPELGDEAPPPEGRKRWHELNKVICEVCEPRLEKRKIATAEALVSALSRIQKGRRRRGNGRAVWITAGVLFALGAGFAGFALRDAKWVRAMLPERAAAPAKAAQYRVLSLPEGAEVYDAKGQYVGISPTSVMDGLVGDEVEFVLRKEGFRPLTLKEVLPPEASEDPYALMGLMEVFSPPEYGVQWSDHRGSKYTANGEFHLAEWPVDEAAWKEYAHGKRELEAAAGRVKDKGQVDAAVGKDDAKKYCAWLRDAAFRQGFLTDEDEMVPDFEGEGDERGRRVFRVKVRKIPYGEIHLTSEPVGAEVFVDGDAAGFAWDTLVVPKLKPGKVKLRVVMEGYKPVVMDVDVRELERVSRHVVLKRNEGVVFGKPWQNGLGMKFVPLGTGLMVSVWETRVRDYEGFVAEKLAAAAPIAGFAQSRDDPAVQVSRDDAQAFCEWLTVRERAQERISALHVYRLPTDEEWSRMVGLEGESGTSPASRDASKLRVFPWGSRWLDEEKVANLADITAAAKQAVPVERSIATYDDGYAWTSPVGSFPANAHGIHDLAGNVQEWVSDEYSSSSGAHIVKLGVLRGGGWTSYREVELYSGTRNAIPPSYRDVMYGFRVVLAKQPTKGEE